MDFPLWGFSSGNQRFSLCNQEDEIFVLSADIGACESIMKKKTKQDFQELIKTEHGNCQSITKLFLLLPARWFPAPGKDAFLLSPADVAGYVECWGSLSSTQG